MGKHKDKRLLRKLKRKIEELEEKTRGSSRSRSPRDRRYTRSPNARPRSRHRSSSTFSASRSRPRHQSRGRTRSPSVRRYTRSPSTRRLTRSPSVQHHTRSPSVQQQQPEDQHTRQPSNAPNMETQMLVDEVPETTEQEVQQIDNEILSAMGAVEEEPVNGPSAHNEIVQRWTPILCKGLSKEDKAGLLKEYIPFHNIPSMVPPN